MNCPRKNYKMTKAYKNACLPHVTTSPRQCVGVKMLKPTITAHILQLNMSTFKWVYKCLCTDVTPSKLYFMHAFFTS